MDKTMENLSKLEEKLDDMQQKLIKLSEQMVELSVRNQLQNETHGSYIQRVAELDRQMQQAKGAINFIKFLATLGGTVVISVCTWLISNQITFQQGISDLNREINHIKSEQAKRYERNISQGEIHEKPKQPQNPIPSSLWRTYTSIPDNNRTLLY